METLRDGPGTGTLADLPADTGPALLDMSIGARLREIAERFPDRPALRWDAGGGELGTLTYRQFADLVERAAADLRIAAGPGERVAVWAANSVQWVVLEFACATAGAVLTPLNTAWTDDEARHALALTTPRLLYTGPDTRGDDLGLRAHRLAGDVPGLTVRDITAITTDAVDGRTSADLPAVDPAAPFLIQFTSGTTGRAKGATLSHRAALNAGHFRVLTYQADETDVWVNPVPLHHIGGSVVIVLAALSSGGCYVVMPRFDPPTMVDLMRRCGATRIGGVPTMLYALLDVPGAHQAVASVQAVGLGGTSVPPSLVDRIQREYGATVSVAYAQSECPMITSTEPHADATAVATTVGVASPHTALRIVDATNTVLRRGEVGELVVRSPLTMLGYWDMPDAAEFDADGFLHTGDLGSIDDDGVLRIHGRAREVIIRGGENVYPVEVEDVVMRHPAVHGVAVLAVPSGRWGEEVGAVVQAGTPQPDIAELEAFAARSLAHFKVPRHWRFVDAFPLTASGKIRKVDLTDLFERAEP